MGQQCAVGKTTAVNEVAACLQRSAQQAGTDACGCKPSEGEGWSSTVGKCAKGSDTAPEEGCECQKSAALRPSPGTSVSLRGATTGDVATGGNYSSAAADELLLP